MHDLKHARRVRIAIHLKNRNMGAPSFPAFGKGGQLRFFLSTETKLLENRRSNFGK